MIFVARAIGLLVMNPRLWPASIAPMALAVIGYFAILFASFLWFVPWLITATSRIGMPDPAGWTTSSLIFTILAVLISGPIFLTLFTACTIPAWDILSKRAEEAVCAGAKSQKVEFSKLAVDIAFRIFFAVIVIIASLVLAILGHGITASFLSGLIMIFDLSAPACYRRGVRFFGQPRLLFHQRGWIGIWIVTSAICFVPFLNLLFLPLLVVAATLLVMSTDSGPSTEVVSTVE